MNDDGAPESELVTTQVRGSAAWITLQRERKLNALSRGLLAALDQAITWAESTEGTRALVLTGAGERAFCAGADLAQVRASAPHEFSADNLAGHRVITRLRRSPLPVIAAVNGVAVGGGLELALACDIRLAVASARLGLPEVGVGVLPGWGGTWRLAEAVGAARARQMVLTGEVMDAATAARLGLVSEVLDDVGALHRRAAELAEVLAGNSASAIARAKALLDADENPRGIHAIAETGQVAALLATDHFRAATAGFGQPRTEETKEQ
ncbi:enoyl-CoA hydratase/isomerase family protein [Pseudactinotalea sp.]|uniref:enoyl-CoA hydratase/isomerase family protein n=1 Tax=Pseudactinotalea sp. TaxID=1926260 RepID=UPI003B3A84FE